MGNGWPPLSLAQPPYKALKVSNRRKRAIAQATEQEKVKRRRPAGRFQERWCNFAYRHWFPLPPCFCPLFRRYCYLLPAAHLVARRRLMRHTALRVDKLTRCIELVETGHSFATQLTPLTAVEAARLNKSDWDFDWQAEQRKKGRQVYKLTTVEQPQLIQGLISLEVRTADLFVFMHLVETAKFNRGASRRYAGVFGNLVAFAGRLSFERNLDGFVVFDAKTALISHYEQTLGATRHGKIRMVLETQAAFTLVSTYYPDFFSI